MMLEDFRSMLMIENAIKRLWGGQSLLRWWRFWLAGDGSMSTIQNIIVSIIRAATRTL